MATDSDSLPLSTLVHMITIKLSSSNYLLWKNQITPLLACQNLLGFVDGSKPSPPLTIMNSAGVSVSNPVYLQWYSQDQRLLSLLLSSLTEESMAEVLGCSSSRAVWLALEAAFSHRSKTRELRLKDDLQLVKKGSRSVSEYGRQFKSICDQLAAIGRPVDDTDKAHWFLRGLGPSFSAFSAAQMALTTIPTFRDLLSKAESYALFQESMEPAGSSPVRSLATLAPPVQLHLPAVVLAVEPLDPILQGVAGSPPLVVSLVVRFVAWMATMLPYAQTATRRASPRLQQTWLKLSLPTALSLQTIPPIGILTPGLLRT